MKQIVLIGLLIIGFAPCLSGNDTFVTLGAGGLVPLKTTAVTMESENLQISTRRIVVRYEFRNTTGRDVTAVVAFPMPELNGGELYNAPVDLPDESASNFMDFAVRSNGAEIPTKFEIRAFDGQKDITSRLKSVGLSGTVLLKPLNKQLAKLSTSTLRQLEQEGLIQPGDFNPPLSGTLKHGWWATWAMRVQFYWTQRFPADTRIELLQSYEPIVGGSYLVTGDDGRESVKPYCGNPETLSRIASIERQHPHKEDADIYLWERRIDYILTTANNWKGPIGRFHVAVTTDEANDFLVTCFQGFEKTGPSKYEFSRTEFRPTSDLKLLLLQRRKPELHSGA